MFWASAQRDRCYVMKSSGADLFQIRLVRAAQVLGWLRTCDSHYLAWDEIDREFAFSLSEYGSKKMVCQDRAHHFIL